MTNTKEDEFFVGYLPTAPPLMGARMRKVSVLLLAVALVSSAIFAWAFRELPAANFEFGIERTFVGTVVESPYPALFVRRPGTTQDLPSYSRYHLVNTGKFGAADAVRGWEGRVAALEGTLIFREGETMIELTAGSLREADGEVIHEGAEQSLGEHTLRGEIVDSKCFLGVMNPGNLKPHRACAARCISGGIPPVLCVRDKSGTAIYLLLVDVDGTAVNDAVLGFVAEPIEITGEVIRIGDQLALHADPTSYRPL